MADSDARLAGLVSWSEDVRVALKRLDPAQRQVVRMIYVESRSRAQIARDLDITPNAVAKTLAAGMRALGLALLATSMD